MGVSLLPLGPLLDSSLDRADASAGTEMYGRGASNCDLYGYLIVTCSGCTCTLLESILAWEGLEEACLRSYEILVLYRRNRRRILPFHL